MSKKTKRSSTKQFIMQVVMLMLLLAGFLIGLYPFYANALNDFIDQRRLEQVKQADSEKAAKELAEKQKENAALAEEGGAPGVVDPFANESRGSIDQAYYDERLIGAVTLLKVDLEVPLFDTTNDLLLNYGATVLQGTSFPVGGTDTHTVISAHSGLPERALFTDLHRLKIGDRFVLTVYDEKLAYEVFEIDTVLPQETEGLQIRKGEDLATLITCTPYMINSHRLLVTGRRVPYTEELAAAATGAVKKRQQINLLVIGGTLLLVAVVLYLLYRALKSYILWHRRGDLIFWRMTENLAAQAIPVAGARFALYDRRGHKPIRRNGQPIEATADAEGRVVFQNLPGRMYIMKELSPQAELKIAVGIKKWRQHQIRFFGKKNQKIVFQNDPKMIIKTGLQQ